MRARSVLIGVCSIVSLGLVPAAATHFDGNPGNGSFDPQMSTTITASLVNRLSDLTFDLTQADHEDPAIIMDLKAPGDWQFGFSTIRQAQKTDGTPTTRCADSIDGLDDSPDGTGVGPNQDFSKRGNAHFVRAEKAGTARLRLAADTITRPGEPAEWTGDVAFISWDAAAMSAQMCILFTTTDTRVTHLPDPIPNNGVDDFEVLSEIVAQFAVTHTSDGTFWVTHADISDIAKDTTFVQNVNLSVLQLKATFAQKTSANWDSAQRTLSKTPLVSGTKTFVGVFQTCPANDPSFGNCKSNKGPVTRTVNIPISLPAPAITFPANGAFLNTIPVAIGGTSDPGAVVRVFEGTTVITDSPPADSAGNWTAYATLLDGTHSVFGKTIDAGGQSPASNTVSFTIDTVAPDKPAITLPVDGATVGGVNVAMAGTAEPSSTVKIYDGGVFKAQTTTPPGGLWAATVTLSKGMHVATVNATDLAGNTSIPSDPTTFFVTTAAPVIQLPGEGSHTNNGNVLIKGTVESGSTVFVYEDTTLIETVVAAGANWSVTHAFSETTHVISAIATALDGFTSPSSPPRTFTVDFTPPPAPVILFPVDGGIVKTSAVPVSGTAEPLSTVAVYEGGQFLGSGTTTSAGTWAVTVTLFNGEHQIHAVATDLAGNVGPASPVITFTVDDPLKILTPGEKATVGGKVVISGDADETSSYVYIYEGGVLLTTTSVVEAKWTVTVPMESGIHSIRIRALTGSKLSPPTDPRTFNVDAKPPVVTIRRPQGYLIFGVQSEAEGTAYDDAPFDSRIARIELTWEDFFTGEVVSRHDATCACPGARLRWTDEALPPSGIYRLTAIAYDGVGNASPAVTNNIILL